MIMVVHGSTWMLLVVVGINIEDLDKKEPETLRKTCSVDQNPKS